MANEVRLTITADAKQAENALKNFKAHVTKAGLALTAMGGGGLIAIKNLTDAALTQEAALRSLQVVVTNAGGNFEGMEAKIMATTAALQQKTNYGDEAQIRVLTQLVPMLGSTEQALAALPAVMEVAAVTNKDFESTVTTLGPVLAGITNKVRGTSLEFDKSEGPMQRVQKILEQMGGTAEAQANPWIQLSNAVGDFKEKVGDALLPMITPVLKGLQGFTELLQKLNPQITNFVAGGLAIVTVVGLTIGPLLLLGSKVLPMLFGALMQVRKVTLLWNLALMMNPAVAILTVVGIAIGVLAVLWTKNVGNIKEKTTNFVNDVGEKLNNLVNNFIRGVKKIAEMASLLLPESFEKAIAGIEEVDFHLGERFDGMRLKVDEFARDASSSIKGFVFKEAVPDMSHLAEEVEDMSGGFEEMAKTIKKTTERN